MQTTVVTAVDARHHKIKLDILGDISSRQMPCIATDLAHVTAQAIKAELVNVESILLHNCDHDKLLNYAVLSEQCCDMLSN